MMRSVFFVTFTLIAAAALAQTSYVIERVDVSAARVRPAIVRAETRLVDGHTYTIQQLDQALYRVRRLPFVVDADYSLDPGSSPEARVMRIKVIDEPIFHYRFEADGVAARHGYVMTTTGLGLRFFPASNGALDVSAGGAGFSTGGGTGSGHFGDLSAQYTAYGLFGRSVFAGVGLSTHYNAKDRLVSPLLQLGIPVTQVQTVRGTYSRSGDRGNNTSIAAAEWLFETNDDPFFARRGMAIAVGPQWQKSRFVADFNSGTPFFFHVDDRTNSRGLAASVARYWPMAEHSALWGRGSGSVFKDDSVNNGRKPPEVDRRFGDVLFGAAHNFDGGRGGADAFRRVRVELGLGYHVDRTSTSQFTSDQSGAEAFAGMAYRSRFGVFRLGVSYIEQ